MIQEIFNNILNHAKANEVFVEMISSPSHFKLKVKDNGVGFDTSQQAKGSGLMNLEERCHLINARLKIESKLNEGTAVLIQIEE